MRRLSIIVSVAILLAVVAADEAKAAFTLSIDSGGVVGALAEVVVVDNGAGDDDPTLGIIDFGGTVGSFMVVAEIGISKPLIGPSAVIDLFNVTVSTGTGTLTVALTDDGFTTPDPIPAIALDIGGTTNGGVVTATGYLGSGMFATTHATDTFTSVGSPFAGTVTSGNIFAPAPYSLTIIATISHTSAGQVTSFDAELHAIPEPSMMIVFGSLIGLCCGFGVLRRRLQG